MNIFRVLIFSPQADRLERLLLRDPLFHVIDAWQGETDIYTRICKGDADVVVLDENMPGTDTLHLLKRLKNTMLPHPRVIYITDTPSPDLLKDVDSCMYSDFDDAAFFHCLHEAFKYPWGMLGQTCEKQCRQLADETCRLLKMDPVLKGFPYVCLCIAIQACRTAPLSQAALYEILSQRFNITAASAERCIRTVIEHTWLHGDLAAISALFGYTVDPEKGKPTNQEFIAMLAQHVKDIMLARQQQKG